jgi:hypothetical protein
MDVYLLWVFRVCCQVDVSVTDRSLVQESYRHTNKCRQWYSTLNSPPKAVQLLIFLIYSVSHVLSVTELNRSPTQKTFKINILNAGTELTAISASTPVILCTARYKTKLKDTAPLNCWNNSTQYSTAHVFYSRYVPTSFSALLICCLECLVRMSARISPRLSLPQANPETYWKGGDIHPTDLCAFIKHNNQQITVRLPEGAHPIPYSMCVWGLLLWGKVAGAWSWQLNVKVKKELSYIPTPPCAHMTYTETSRPAV